MYDNTQSCSLTMPSAPILPRPVTRTATSSSQFCDTSGFFDHTDPSVVHKKIK